MMSIPSVLHRLFRVVATSYQDRRPAATRTGAEQTVMGELVERLEERCLLTAGILDPTFDGDGRQTTAGFDGAEVAVFGNNGQIVQVGQIGGTGTALDGQMSVTRYNADGSIDTTFGAAGTGHVAIAVPGATTATGVSVAVEAGLIYVLGTSFGGPNGSDLVLTRLDANGLVDATFNGGAPLVIDVSASDAAVSIAVDTFGRAIYAANSAGDIVIGRINADGTIDNTFNGTGQRSITLTGGEVAQVITDAGRRILFVGTATNATAARGPEILVMRLLEDGSTDASFGTAGQTLIDYGNTVDSGGGIALDSMARILVAGSSTAAMQQAQFAVARLTSNGGFDNSFAGNGRQRIQINANGPDAARSITEDFRGRIVVGGVTRGTPTDDPNFAIARLLANGTTDNEFRPGAPGFMQFEFGFGNGDQMANLVMDPIGRIVTGGVTLRFGQRAMAVARLDSEENAGPFTTDIDLTVDEFAPNRTLVGTVPAIPTSPDDELCFVIESGNTFNAFEIDVDTGEIRVRDGSVIDFDNVQAFDLVVRVSDKRVPSFSNISNVHIDVIKFIPGRPDVSFDDDGRATLSVSGGNEFSNDVAAFGVGGKVVVVGQEGNNAFAARFNADGTPDRGFGTNGRVILDFGSGDDFAFGVAVTEKNQTIIVGHTLVNGVEDLVIMRLNVNGSVDTTFGQSGGLTRVNLGQREFGARVRIDSQGRLLVAGLIQKTNVGGGNNSATDRDFVVFRFTENGILDTSFNGNGIRVLDFGSPVNFGRSETANDVTTDELGRILVIGHSFQNGTNADFAVARLLEDGRLDPTFGTGGQVLIDFEGGQFDFGRTILVDQLGRIIVGGFSAEIVNNDRFSDDMVLARLNSDGTLDTTFSGDGRATFVFGGNDDITIQPLVDNFDVLIDEQNRIVFGGRADEALFFGGGNPDNQDFMVARLLDDGSLDTEFGVDLTPDDGDDDNDINEESDIPGVQFIDIGRDVDMDGDLDVTTTDFLTGLVQDDLGRILAGGYSDQGPTNFDIAVVRLLGQQAVIPPFADIASLADGNTWYGQRSLQTRFEEVVLGSWDPTATWLDILEGDFNGDDITDIVARRADNGEVHVLLSDGNSFKDVVFARWTTNLDSRGQTWQDVSVGDFDGDGDSDLAARYNGNWWVALSTGTGFRTVAFGDYFLFTTYRDVMVGDFNNDGRDDIVGRYDRTVFRDGEFVRRTIWQVWESSGQEFQARTYAIWNNDRPFRDAMVADFNGDGVDDIGARRYIAERRRGDWWIGISNNSSFNLSIYGSWTDNGTNTFWIDIKAADFDNDGDADIVARRSTNSTWWISESDAGAFTNRTFGKWSGSVTWLDVTFGDFNLDGQMDVAGRVDGTDRWWVGVSNGTRFINEAWGEWTINANWSETRSGNFLV